LDTRILLQVFLRTYLVGATFNTRGMQNVGLAFIMEPGLRALYAADPAALKRARGRYLNHYNPHPYWTPLLAGILLAMERKIALGMLPADILPKLRSTTVYTLSALATRFSAAASWSCGPWSGSTWRPQTASGSGLLGAPLPGGPAVFQDVHLRPWLCPGLAFLQRLKSWGSSTGDNASSWSTGSCWPCSCCRSRPGGGLDPGLGGGGACWP
jgi:PTS system mannose-specific IID component